MATALHEMAQNMFPLMRELQPEGAPVIERLSLAAIEDSEAFASYHRFEDESSRVLVSDGLVGLLRMLAELTSIWYYEVGGAGWVRAFRMARAINELHADERHVPVLAVALRWNLVHRRVWGKSANLAVEPEGEDATFLCDLYSQLAWMFVVAHECAHALLGHTAEDAGDWRAEHAADTLAFKVVHAFVDGASGQAPEMHALVAARLAFLSAALVEGALFVRPPVQHPSATERWRAVAASANERTAAAKADVVTAGLAAAAVRATDPRFSLPASWWKTAYDDKHVHRDVHEPSYYDQFPLFDRLSFGDPEDPARVLQGLPLDEGRQVLDAAFVARDHSLRAGLQQLGLADDVTELAADRSAPLSVHSLLQLIFESPVVSAISDPTRRRIGALSASTLIGGLERGIF